MNLFRIQLKRNDSQEKLIIVIKWDRYCFPPPPPSGGILQTMLYIKLFKHVRPLTSVVLACNVVYLSNEWNV